MVYKYLYQDRQNRNCEGEVKARNRAEAYLLLRKQGVRPYRVIGDDPFNWRPWAVGAGYAVLIATIIVLICLNGPRSVTSPVATVSSVLTEEEARRFREKAEEAVYRAPAAYRYNVWVGVNARLAERGLPPVEKPEGLTEEP